VYNLAAYVENPNINSKNNDGGTQAELLLKLIEEKENLILFHDDKNDGYISVKIGDHQENMPLKSKAMRRWLTKELW
jgi:hypothetical protein